MRVPPCAAAGDAVPTASSTAAAVRMMEDVANRMGGRVSRECDAGRRENMRADTLVGQIGGEPRRISRRALRRILSMRETSVP